MFTFLKEAYLRFQMSRTADALYQMSDSTLAALGISRDEIPQRVREIYQPTAEQSVSVAVESNSNDRQSQAA